jgi:DNA replication and repair protein RecF
MHLETLQLINFKNYSEVLLQFPGRINVLVGKNGSGKTNLLDAIFYLGFTKSAFSADQQCISGGQNYFFIKGKFKMESKSLEVDTSLQIGAKKIFREDSIEYQKLSDHIGKYPIILIAPDDVDLIRGGSEDRRKFFDGIISQLDRVYLENLMHYNHTLRQRNSLLKMFSERGGPVDWVAIETYDHVLIRLGNSIFEKRKEFSLEFLPVFNKYYHFLVENAEQTKIIYTSDLNDSSYKEGLVTSRQRDLNQQRTTFGIHRDDYEFLLGEDPLKRLGSQGQQKSFVIAMKLAQFEIIENHKGFKPILLLDDIFDKLDDFRIARLLELIKNEFGQLFITDARPERTKNLLDRIQVPSMIFTIDRGKVSFYE